MISDYSIGSPANPCEPGFSLSLVADLAVRPLDDEPIVLYFFSSRGCISPQIVFCSPDDLDNMQMSAGMDYQCVQFFRRD